MKYFLRCNRELLAYFCGGLVFRSHILKSKAWRSAQVVGKIKFTHLDNTVIADELPNAVEDEGEAHAKHN